MSAVTGFSLNGYGFITVNTYNEKFNDITNTKSMKTSPINQNSSAGYSLNGYGFVGCGNRSFNNHGRYDDVANTATLRLDYAIRYPTTGYATNEYFINYIIVE